MKLRDKLVGPTKEESYAILQKTYSQEAIVWLTDLVKQMKPVDKVDKVIYYIDGQWYMFQNKNSVYLYISYDKIWRYLEQTFGYNYNEIMCLIKGIVEMNTNLMGVTPTYPIFIPFTRVEMNTNLRV